MDRLRLRYSKLVLLMKWYHAEEVSLYHRDKVPLGHSKMALSCCSVYWHHVYFFLRHGQEVSQVFLKRDKKVLDEIQPRLLECQAGRTNGWCCLLPQVNRLHEIDTGRLAMQEHCLSTSVALKIKDTITREIDGASKKFRYSETENALPNPIGLCNPIGLLLISN